MGAVCRVEATSQKRAREDFLVSSKHAKVLCGAEGEGTHLGLLA